MQSQQPAPQEDLAQWLKAFEQQKTALEQQIEQFTVLQEAVQGLFTQAASSPKAAKQLGGVEELEQSADYTQLRDRALSQLERLEQQFSQLVDWCADPPMSSSENQRQERSAVAQTPPLQQATAKKRARGFV